MSELQDGTLWLGNAPLVTGSNYSTSNGIIHVLGGVITSDGGFNETTVEAAEKLGDFGPFNYSEVETDPLLDMT